MCFRECKAGYINERKKGELDEYSYLDILLE